MNQKNHGIYIYDISCMYKNSLQTVAYEIYVCIAYENGVNIYSVWRLQEITLYILPIVVFF